jgi:hypothetical protein
MSLIWIVGIIAFFWMWSQATDKDSHGEALFASVMAAGMAMTAAFFVLAIFGVVIT